LTILVATFEFIFPALEAVLTYTEAGVAFITLGLIAHDLSCQFKEGWLTARYKAENLRLLKFRNLTDSRLWCPPIDMKLLREELEDEVRRLEGHNCEKAKAWASEGVHPRICAPPCEKTCDEALHELIDYYRPKRLYSQTEYLSQKAEKSEKTGAWTARVVRWVFFISFAFVLTHVVLRFYTEHEKREAARRKPPLRLRQNTERMRAQMAWLRPKPPRVAVKPARQPTPRRRMTLTLPCSWSHLLRPSR
jgi:hypothetical protein